MCAHVAASPGISLGIGLEPCALPEQGKCLVATLTGLVPRPQTFSDETTDHGASDYFCLKSTTSNSLPS